MEFQWICLIVFRATLSQKNHPKNWKEIHWKFTEKITKKFTAKFRDEYIDKDLKIHLMGNSATL
jgi:hypothetical protein